MTAPKWISRLSLRRDDGATGALVGLLQRSANDAGAHELIWSLFGDDPARKRDFLYRAEDMGAGQSGFLCVSARPPEDRHALWNIEVKPYDPVVEAGQILSFVLRANPTVTRDGKRHDVVMDMKRRLGKQPKPSEAEISSNAEIWQAAGEKWLADRAGRLGAELLACRADGYRVLRFKRGRGKETGQISLASLDLSGRFRVVDPKALRRALFEGVGHGKAWGCGLLLVKPG